MYTAQRVPVCGTFEKAWQMESRMCTNSDADRRHSRVTVTEPSIGWLLDGRLSHFRRWVRVSW